MLGEYPLLYERFINLRNLQNALRNFEIAHAHFMQVSDINQTVTLTRVPFYQP